MILILIHNPVNHSFAILENISIALKNKEVELRGPGNTPMEQILPNLEEINNIFTKNQNITDAKALAQKPRLALIFALA